MTEEKTVVENTVSIANDLTQLPQKNWKDSPVPGEISFLLYSLPKLLLLFSKCLVLTYYM